jgi:hypothetical protein
MNGRKGLRERALKQALALSTSRRRTNPLSREGTRVSVRVFFVGGGEWVSGKR